jgi:hypothetical protein
VSTLNDLVLWLREQIAADRDEWTPVLSGARKNGKATARTVLAQCGAHEAILKVHNVWSVVYPGDTVDADPDRHCVGCGFDAMEEYRTPDVNDCPTLRAVALAYQHRPGYREEWRP